MSRERKKRCYKRQRHLKSQEQEMKKKEMPWKEMWRTRDSNRKRCHATELSFKPGLAQILQTPCRYWTPETFAHGLPGYDLYASLLFLAHWMCATPHDAPPPKCPCRVSTAANQTTERRSRIGCRLRRNLVFLVLKNWDWAYDRPCGHVNAMPATSCNHFVKSVQTSFITKHPQSWWCIWLPWMVILANFQGTNHRSTWWNT